MKIKIYIEPVDYLDPSGEKKNIIIDGCRSNPNIELVNDKNDCDYIFFAYMSDINLVKNYNKYADSKKKIIIDFRDNRKEVFDMPCLKYFKRSIVDKETLTIEKYDREIIPIIYPLKLETLELIQFKNLEKYQRNIDVSTLFRTEWHGRCKQQYRTKIANFIKDNFNDYNIHAGLCGEPGKLGRTTIQNNYYDKMFHSKIVVTCNPDSWEGDYRTMEALSSGALVMVDKMITPTIYPLIDKKHIVFYDRNNLKELRDKILYYLNNEELRMTIAKEGNKYAIEHHKPSDRIDEILSAL
jgi:hypothetical protein